MTMTTVHKIEIGRAVDAMADTIQMTMDELKPQYWQMVQHTDAVKLITSSSHTRSIIFGQLTWCFHKYKVVTLEHLDGDVLEQAIYPIIN